VLRLLYLVFVKSTSFLLTFLFLISWASLHAQTQAPGSSEAGLLAAQPQADTLQPVQQVDSTLVQANQVIDKANATDTVIYNAVSKTDTVFQAADEGLSKINQAAGFPNAAVNRGIDSVQFLNKAYSAEQRTLDSLNRAINAPADKLSEIEAKIEDPTIGRVNGITSEVNEGLGNVGIQHSIDQPGGIGASDQLRPDGQGGLLPGSPGIPGLDATTNALDKLNEAGEVLDKAQGITEQTKNIGMEVGNISRGDFENTETISGLAESQLQKTGVFKTLGEETGAFGDLGMTPGAAFNVPSADNVKDMALAMAQQEAMEKFAAHGKRVQAAISEINKVKGKYSEVESYRNKKMVKAASMKGKPWQHRIYPSLLFQVLNGQEVTVDFRPGIHYRPYGRWTLNGGAVFRTHFSKKEEVTLPIYRIKGGFLSTEFAVWKSFSLFTMGQLVDVKREHPLTGYYTRYNHWDWLLGIKKDFRFTRHIKGTSQAGYNFLYDRFTSPYTSRWHLMFGVYYKFMTKEERDKRKRFGKH
jgi:hypothetical protein